MKQRPVGKTILYGTGILHCKIEVLEDEIKWPSYLRIQSSVFSLYLDKIEALEDKIKAEMASLKEKMVKMEEEIKMTFLSYI